MIDVRFLKIFVFNLCISVLKKANINKVHLGFGLGCTFCLGYRNSGGYCFSFGFRNLGV